MRNSIKMKVLFGMIFLAAVFCTPIAGSATIIGGAGDPGYDPDDGSTAFLLSGPVVVIEMLDLAAGIFGYYENSNPANYGIIFEAEDQGGTQVAYMDLDSGFILDIDTGGSLQGDFFPPITGEVGFFLNLGTVTLFTNPVINPIGLDFTASFPHSTIPGQYQISFEVDIEGEPIVIATYVIAPYTPPNTDPVPVSSSLLMMFAGVLTVAGQRRQNK